MGVKMLTCLESKITRKSFQIATSSGPTENKNKYNSDPMRPIIFSLNGFYHISNKVLECVARSVGLSVIRNTEFPEIQNKAISQVNPLLCPIPLLAILVFEVGF